MLRVTPSSEQKYLGVAVNDVRAWEKEGKCSAFVVWSPVLTRSCQARAAGTGRHLRSSFLEGHKVKNEENDSPSSAWQAGPEPSV